MKKNIFKLAFFIIFIVFIIGCEKQSNIDSITIVSLNPSENLSESTQVITVVVDYVLSSINHAQLRIAFTNPNNVNTFLTVSSQDVIVTRGSGSHTFNPTVTPKDWGQEGDYRVMVLLIQQGGTTSLANEIKTLYF